MNTNEAGLNFDTGFKNIRVDSCSFVVFAPVHP